MTRSYDPQAADKLTPRERLSHKLRDGKYRAIRMGCEAELVTISQADASGLLAEKHCHYCGCELGVMYALEHKQPLARGGPHTLANLAKSCMDCNESKHIQEELEYLASLDFSVMQQPLVERMYTA